MKRWTLFFPYALLIVIVGAAVFANVPPIRASRGDRPPEPNTGGRLTDIVCHMEVNPNWGHNTDYKGQTYYFCNRRCLDRFLQTPEHFLARRCVVCDQILSGETAYAATYLGQTYELCSDAHRRAFEKEPAAYFIHTMWGVPSWLYYISIAIVLLVSFGIFDWLSRSGRASAGQDLSVAPAAGMLSAPSAAGRSDRLDLFSVRWIRAAARWRPLRFLLQAFVAALFVLIVAAGLFGNQSPAKNIVPILTWTLWWGLLIILIMFTGKSWCYVCPWDAIAGWTERLTLWRKTRDSLSLGLHWPRMIRNISLATILFVGLTWIELGFGVTMKPRATAYLAIGMLLLTVASALLFDRKSFCRYGCLVGRVSGLYAMFSSIELRARSKDTFALCRTKECVKGSEDAYGCPTYLYPGKMQTNTYCIQCMECVQACPHDNLAFRLRPWGSDLAVEGHPRSDEAYLALLMLSITGFHGLTMTQQWPRWIKLLGEAFDLGQIVAFSLGMTLLMVAPVLVYAGLVAWSRHWARSSAAGDIPYKSYFVRYAYALLPIALFYHIAHNLEHLLMEGPKTLALASDPFGWGWNLFGTASWKIPPLISLDILWFVQVLLVLVGHVYSLWVAQKTSRRLFGTSKAALRSQVPMLIGMIAFSVFSLWLLKQPMEMRTSAM